jgi:hypothetical protein
VQLAARRKLGASSADATVVARSAARDRTDALPTTLSTFGGPLSRGTLHQTGGGALCGTGAPSQSRMNARNLDSNLESRMRQRTAPVAADEMIERAGMIWGKASSTRISIRTPATDHGALSHADRRPFQEWRWSRGCTKSRRDRALPSSWDCEPRAMRSTGYRVLIASTQSTRACGCSAAEPTIPRSAQTRTEQARLSLF